MTIDERYDGLCANLTATQLGEARLAWKLEMMSDYYNGRRHSFSTLDEHEFVRWHRARLFAADDNKQA